MDNLTFEITLFPTDRSHDYPECPNCKTKLHCFLANSPDCAELICCPECIAQAANAGPINFT